MPKVEKSIISKRNKIVSDLEKIVKSENILSDKDELRPYETDALAAYTQSPMLVVVPETVKEELSWSLVPSPLTRLKLNISTG